MAKAPAFVPPPDPDLRQLAVSCARAWEIDRPTTIALDTETTGLGFHDTAFGASVAWRSPREDVLTGQPIGVEGYWLEFERFDSRPLLRAMMNHAQVIVMHNFKFDAHKLEAQGLPIPEHVVWHDTECMAHLDNEHVAKGLKDLAVSVLGFDDLIGVPGKQRNKETGQQEDVVRMKPKSKVEIDKAREWAKKQHGLRSIKDVGYHLLPRGVVVPYAILDAEWTLNLAAKLWPRVNRYPDLRALYDQEMTLTRTAIYDMEKAGLRVSTDYVDAKVKEYRGRVIDHELRIEQVVCKPVRTGDVPPKEKDNFFNPASRAQVGAYFEAHGHKRDSYDADALKTIAHPLAEALLAFRKDKKILDSYFVSLQKATGADGIYHQSSRQHGTVSGRTSGGKERGDQ